MKAKNVSAEIVSCLCPSASWLMKDGEGFYWCFSCNEKTDRILEDTTDYEALLKELSNLK